MTATELLDALTRVGRRPRVEGPEIVFSAPPPAVLVSPLTVLLTGVRALLTGRRWYGIDRSTGLPCGPHPAVVTARSPSVRSIRRRNCREQSACLLLKALAKSGTA